MKQVSSEDILELKIHVPVTKAALEWERERLRDYLISLATCGIDSALKDLDNNKKAINSA